MHYNKKSNAVLITMGCIIIIVIPGFEFCDLQYLYALLPDSREFVVVLSCFYGGEGRGNTLENLQEL